MFYQQRKLYITIQGDKAEHATVIELLLTVEDFRCWIYTMNRGMKFKPKLNV